MEDLEKVKERIRKLLALADNNPNVHEAANAAAQAQKLMERYRIEKIAYDIDHDIKDVEQVYEGIGRSGSPLDSAGRLSTWKIQLANALAQVNGCRIYISHMRVTGKSRKEIVMVGVESNMQMIRTMYAYLTKEIDRLCKEYCSGQGFSRSEGRVAGNNFRLGAIDVIDERLTAAAKEERERMKQEIAGDDTKAIARFETALQALDELEKAVERWMNTNLNLKPGRTSAYQGDASAYRAGQRAGQSIDLDKGKK